MDEKNKKCDIVSDLLPMYLEQATQPETDSFIKEHLKECESCRQNYEWMKGSFTEVFTEDEKHKKGRKKSRKKKVRMFKKVKWKMLIYAYVFFLVSVWLYCVLDLLFFF